MPTCPWRGDHRGADRSVRSLPAETCRTSRPDRSAPQDGAPASMRPWVAPLDLGVERATSLELLANKRGVDIDPPLTHFPLIVKIEEEDDGYSNILAALFVMALRGTLPNGAVALHQAGLFNVRPVAPTVLEVRKEPPDRLTPDQRGALVHAVMHAGFGERVRDDIGVPAGGHAGVERLDVARHERVGVLGPCRS